MDYPPDGCDYQVAYLNDGHETDGERFPDEYELGRWMMQLERAGDLDRECEGLLFRIYAITEHQRIPIDLQHPKLVQGRLNLGPARARS